MTSSNLRVCKTSALIFASAFEGAHLQAVAGAAISINAGAAPDQDAYAMAVMMMAMCQRDGGQGTRQ